MLYRIEGFKEGGGRIEGEGADLDCRSELSWTGNCDFFLDWLCIENDEKNDTAKLVFEILVKIDKLSQQFCHKIFTKKNVHKTISAFVRNGFVEMCRIAKKNTEKSFLNLVNPYQIWIVITIFR